VRRFAVVIAGSLVIAPASFIGATSAHATSTADSSATTLKAGFRAERLVKSYSSTLNNVCPPGTNKLVLFIAGFKQGVSGKVVKNAGTKAILKRGDGSWVNMKPTYPSSKSVLFGVVLPRNATINKSATMDKAVIYVNTRAATKRVSLSPVSRVCQKAQAQVRPASPTLRSIEVTQDNTAEPQLRLVAASKPVRLPASACPKASLVKRPLNSNHFASYAFTTGNARGRSKVQQVGSSSVFTTPLQAKCTRRIFTLQPAVPKGRILHVRAWAVKSTGVVWLPRRTWYWAYFRRAVDNIAGRSCPDSDLLTVEVLYKPLAGATITRVKGSFAKLTAVRDGVPEPYPFQVRQISGKRWYGFVTVRRGAVTSHNVADVANLGGTTSYGFSCN